MVDQYSKPAYVFALPTARRLIFTGTALLRTLTSIALLSFVTIGLPAHANEPLFDDSPPAEKGWKGLAKVLDVLTPSVDTRVPLTASQITDRISRMISDGRYDEALSVIQKRKAQRQQQDLMGDDVQLMFLEARALAASGQHDQAIRVYHDMTVQYPELPEPWNNLASEYTKQGNLDMAQSALQTALSSDPNYAEARLNLGIVQLMMARESFNQAADLGAQDAKSLATQTTQILKP